VKKSKKMAFLFFALIPIGIIILIFSVRIVRKTFSGEIILEIPYTRKSAEFSLTHPGKYSVWHKGQYFRKAPLDEFEPVITNKSTGERTRLFHSVFRPNANNGMTARMELYRFSAPAGDYLLELDEGSSISAVENTIISFNPASEVDHDRYFIQIRESQPFFIGFIGVILIAFAGFCIIGGLVLGILADQIFK
jgi:hypothetical protein